VTNLLVLSRDALLSARLRDAWEPTFRVVRRDEWSEVPAAVRELPAALLAVDTGRSAGIRPVPSFGWLRTAFPGLGLLVIVDPGEHQLAFALGRSADGVVVAGPGASSRSLLRAVETSLARALARVVEHRARSTWGPIATRCLGRAVEWAEHDVDAATLAAHEGIGVASLRHELRTGGAPSPGRLLRWGRILRAIDGLGRGTATAESVAHRFGYSSGAALGRAIRREVGVPITTVHSRGGVEWALEAFLHGVPESGA
jgi:AraC-like DNA-binding protein